METNLGYFLSTNAKFGERHPGIFNELEGTEVILHINGVPIEATLGKLDKNGLEIRFDKIDMWFKEPN